MRWTTSKLFDLAKSISLGERGQRDAQLEIPAMVSPVVILPSQIKDLALPASLTELHDSSNFRASLNVAGVGGGNTVTGQALEPGVWRLTGYFCSQFTGTTNIANGSLVSLNELTGADNLVLGSAQSIAPHNIVIPIDLVFSSPVKLRLLFMGSVTVALDNLNVLASIHCGRLI